MSPMTDNLNITIFALTLFCWLIIIIIIVNMSEMS